MHEHGWSEAGDFVCHTHTHTHTMASLFVSVLQTQVIAARVQFCMSATFIAYPWFVREENRALSCALRV